MQLMMCGCLFFQAEDGIRDLVRSRGLGDVYKRQVGVMCAWVDDLDPGMRRFGFNPFTRAEGDQVHELSLIHI